MYHFRNTPRICFCSLNSIKEKKKAKKMKMAPFRRRPSHGTTHHRRHTLSSCVSLLSFLFCLFVCRTQHSLAFYLFEFLDARSCASQTYFMHWIILWHRKLNHSAKNPSTWNNMKCNRQRMAARKTTKNTHQHCSSCTSAAINHKSASGYKNSSFRLCAVV